MTKKDNIDRLGTAFRATGFGTITYIAWLAITKLAGY
jgi:hypothetical protein